MQTLYILKTIGCFIYFILKTIFIFKYKYLAHLLTLERKTTVLIRNWAFTNLSKKSLRLCDIVSFL